MSPSEGPEILQFEGFRLDRVHRTLRAPDGQPVELKAKVFDTLLALATRPAEVVPKSDLLEAVWPDVVVEENNLNQAISALRKALDAHKPNSRLIVTVPGRGYQLAAVVTTAAPAPDTAAESTEVRQQSADEPLEQEQASQTEPPSPVRNWNRSFLGRPTTWGAVLACIAAIAIFVFFLPGGESRERSIAVLPFENLDADEEQDYFARGVALETLNLLTQLDGLEVIARNSSFSYGPNADVREVAENLSVANVLTGAVRTQGESLIVSAQLVDGASGRAIWTREYSRPLSPDDIFQIQRQIARNVAGALSITFGAQDSAEFMGAGTASLEAYDLYLKGMAIWTGNLEGDMIVAFRRATELDPGYAAAWAGLAISTAGSSWNQPTPQDAAAVQREAYEYARQAVELDPGLSQAQSVFGAVSCTQFKWIEAEAALARSMAIGPNEQALNHRMMLRLRMGRINDAAADMIGLDRIDPLLAFGNVGPATLRAALGDHANNLQIIRNAQTSRPWDSNTERLLLHGLIHSGAPRDQIRASFENFAARGESGVAQLFSALLEVFDRPDDARVVLLASFEDETFRHPYKWDLIPLLAAWYGDDDLVLRVWREEFPINQVRTALMWGPAFAPVRARAEFRDLMREIGIDEYWRNVAWADKCRPISDTDFLCD